MPGADSIYRAAPNDALLLRPLGGLTALYHRPSGQTHVVDSPVPEILAALADSPLSAEALFTSLSAQFDLGEDGEARAGLADHLAQLVALGLIDAA